VIDDFGTGFSSLSYLKMLKPDKLKIDRSFVRDLPDDPDDRALVQAIIGMAQALSITVVGEGVETEAQCEMLRKFGCRLQQGYLHGRPMPAAAFAAALQPPELLDAAVSR
jgi:EAL domain-containing protein (putative c-di-GMP-specific phosphodiesterase class I)